MDRVRAGRAPLVTLIAAIITSTFFFSAAPATAAGRVPGIVAEAKPWHYWASYVLIASVAGLFFMTMLGYLVKVVAAKYGIRIGRRSAG